VRLDVRPGLVVARLEGGQATPRTVAIRLAPFPDATWERILDGLAAEAAFGARLLDGELPVGIEEVFAAAGVSLFPRREGDLAFACTCSDARRGPCKHIAAAYLVLGERIAADPLALFHLRGRPADRIAAGLRARRAAPPVEEGGLAWQTLVSAAQDAVAGYAGALLDSLEPAPGPRRRLERIERGPGGGAGRRRSGQREAAFQKLTLHEVPDQVGLRRLVRRGLRLRALEHQPAVGVETQTHVLKGGPRGPVLALEPGLRRERDGRDELPALVSQTTQGIEECLGSQPRPGDLVAKDDAHPLVGRLQAGVFPLGHGAPRPGQYDVAGR
jgi:hypothetical protein